MNESGNFKSLFIKIKGYNQNRPSYHLRNTIFPQIEHKKTFINKHFDIIKTNPFHRIVNNNNNNNNNYDKMKTMIIKADEKIEI